jgi:hypothetical protein
MAVDETTKETLLRTAEALQIHPGSVYEVRVLKDGGIEARMGSRDGKRLAEFAQQYSGRPGLQVYMTINPSEPDPQGYVLDKVGTSPCIKGGQVTRRCLLPIDVDPKRATADQKVNATDAEKQKAREVTDAIHSYLMALGWPAPIACDSGNGWHLLYRIDLPNDDASKRLVNDVLEALAYQFDNADASVDTSLFDAGRIVKFYGTLAQKGTPTADRPARPSEILEVPTPPACVTREQLAQVAGIVGGARGVDDDDRPPRNGHDRDAA